jgi:uncharacterized protein YraI
MNCLRRSALVSLSLASLSLAVPALAHAADGYVTGNVTLRAGPAPDYPLIALIPAGTEVDVQGCTDGWEWCDVIAYGNRGWIAGNYVEYEYENQPVLLPAYGAQIGIPIVTFVIGSYWDNHYRNRPFYRERSRWYRRPIEHRPPPPPLRHPYRPPLHGSPGHGRPPGNPPRPPISHQPRPGPITPPPGLRPTPGNRPESARPARTTAAPPERAAGHAPTGRPSKGKPPAGDKNGDHDDH